MTRRSVTNDRYRVEQKGKTRKSASSAKPKRAAGEASSSPKKAQAKPTSALGRLFGEGSGARSEQTPEMRQLRRVWWVLMGVAVALAVVMLWTSKLDNTLLNRGVLGGYALALGGALYLEFGPLRRMRIEAAAAAKKGSKGAKSASKGAKDAGTDPKKDGAKSA